MNTYYLVTSEKEERYFVISKGCAVFKHVILKYKAIPALKAMETLRFRFVLE